MLKRMRCITNTSQAATSPPHPSPLPQGEREICKNEICYTPRQNIYGHPMQWGILFAVALGGAVGSLLRYFTASAIQPVSSTFPWGIFIVNITGGFLMGVIVELGALKLNFTPEMRSFLTVGILGGYTTFSTFSLDSVLLIQRGAYASAAAYMVGSAVLSVLALFAGLWLVRAI